MEAGQYFVYACYHCVFGSILSTRALGIIMYAGEHFCNYHVWQSKHHKCVLSGMLFTKAGTIIPTFTEQFHVLNCVVLSLNMQL